MSMDDPKPVLTTDDVELGDYDFSIGAILSESWKRTNGLKGAFWAAGAIAVFAILGLSIFVGGGMSVVVGNADSIAGVLSSVLLQLVIMAVMYPYAAGVMMLGIDRSVDLPVSYKSVFGYFPYTLPLLAVAVLMSVLITIGFLLLLAPGIYLSLAYIFAVPLVVEKNLGIWEAMETSRRKVTRHWFKLFFLFLIMGIILFISALPFGLGLIWTYPMTVAMVGVLYRDIFGVETAETSLQP